MKLLEGDIGEKLHDIGFGTKSTDDKSKNRSIVDIKGETSVPQMTPAK